MENKESKRKFNCDQCDSSYTRNDNLKRHKYEKHDPNAKIYKCDCGKYSTKDLQHLKLHQDTVNAHGRLHSKLRRPSPRAWVHAFELTAHVAPFRNYRRDHLPVWRALNLVYRAVNMRNISPSMNLQMTLAIQF